MVVVLLISAGGRKILKGKVKKDSCYNFTKLATSRMK
jgi:hypothetical protein